MFSKVKEKNLQDPMTSSISSSPIRGKSFSTDFFPARWSNVRLLDEIGSPLILVGYFWQQNIIKINQYDVCAVDDPEPA